MYRNLFIVFWASLLLLLNSCFSDNGESANCGNLELEIDKTGCTNGEYILQVNVTGGKAPYEFRLNDENSSMSNQFDNLVSGSYFIRVIDKNGCELVSKNVLLGSKLSLDVMPIIRAKCARSGCHLDTQDPLMTSNLRVVNAADRIFTQLTEGNMPPNGNISNDETKTILDWINCGAQNN